VTDPARVTAVVLAGGRSARFGDSKLDALVDGERLLDRAVRAVAAVTGEIVIAGPPPATSIAPMSAPVRFALDDEAFGGPLAAVAGVLASLTTELAIVVGGDMPALAPAVLDLMLQRLIADLGVDAVVLAAPRTAHAEPPKAQVLPIALRVGPAAQGASEALRAGDRSLVRLLGTLRSIEVPAIEWLAFDPSGGTLLDVDIPADLERFRARDLQ
jgi:molybdopterin-guanine dinucleotide biosynthesis protein A